MKQPDKVVDWEKALENLKEAERRLSLCVICKVNTRPSYTGLGSKSSELFGAEYICPDCQNEIHEQQLYDHAYFLVNESGGDIVLVVKEILRLMKGVPPKKNPSDIIYGKRK